MNLQNLDLSSNKIKTIHSHAFRFNNKLEVLNLSKNNLSFDSDNQPIWDDLTNLKILDLSRNHIKLKEMPYQWKTLARNLHSLNLSDNQIGPELSFQDFDFKQTDLRVNLDDNAIRKITFEDGTKPRVDDDDINHGTNDDDDDIGSANANNFDGDARDQHYKTSFALTDSYN